MSDTAQVQEWWHEVCEAVNELDEPPVRRCPRCASLCYEVPQHTYNCPRCGTFASEVPA